MRLGINAMNLNTRILPLLAIFFCFTPFKSSAETPEISPSYFTILRNGDPKQLLTALNGGAPVNARDAEGNTPLMLATVYGDVACVKTLLDHGAAVNATNDAGASALLHASFDYQKVELLVAHGANVNIHSALGDTPLMLAARPADSHAAVALLLAQGASVNVANNWGATPLMAAAAGGDVASVKMLLRNGADANAQPALDPPGFVLGGGRSALDWAAYRGNIPVMKLLLTARADVNAESFLGTPLVQAAWNDDLPTASFLIAHGAHPDQVGHGIDYTALHWAAQSEHSDPALVKLLLAHGANPNLNGGQSIDSLVDPQTPVMLAQRRGGTPILTTLLLAGANNESPDWTPDLKPITRENPDSCTAADAAASISQALLPLQASSIFSKTSFVQSHQDCVSCHQQFIPLAAISLAEKRNITIDTDAKQKLIDLVSAGDLKNPETDWEPLFHPSLAHSKGYMLFGDANANLPANEITDSSVHHLAVIQAADGRWCNNMPRPPMQSDDVSSTALAIHALQAYPLPGRQAEFTARVNRARKWLWTVKAENQEERIYQLLGLAWAGESPKRLRPLANALLAEQRPDGGWAQLQALNSDAYATG
ncbi:MAG TPA: ankyrin repeat domain-containing protein, partial [Verrucomicrobiae bacterium]|nr:ankyrin repeat domain-containing protein [Verrucomicrobiae bacterium]